MSESQAPTRVDATGYTGNPIIVGADAESDIALLRVVRDAVAKGIEPGVEPDDLLDDPSDLAAWVAFASVLVAEGVVSLTTRHERDARRIFDMHAAITAADAAAVEVRR